jgi:hypothetical protein
MPGLRQVQELVPMRLPDGVLNQVGKDDLEYSKEVKQAAFPFHEWLFGRIRY